MISWIRNLWWRYQKGSIIYYQAEFPEARNFVEFKNKFDEIGFKFSAVHLSGYNWEIGGKAIADIEISGKELVQFNASLNQELFEWRNCIKEKQN
ncbi:hypothetical protein ACFL16_01640 [Patescibacteria group bacterium]